MTSENDPRGECYHNLQHCGGLLRRARPLVLGDNLHVAIQICYSAARLRRVSYENACRNLCRTEETSGLG